MSRYIFVSFPQPRLGSLHSGYGMLSNVEEKPLNNTEKSPA